MSVSFFLKAAMAATLAFAANGSALAATEILDVRFDRPTGAVTTGLYAGVVRIKASGTGVIWPGRTSDAFYFEDMPGVPQDYQLTFDTAPILQLATSRQASNFIVGGRPSYQASHIYEFALDTRALAPSRLYFGMWDGVFEDNSGTLRLEISASAVPELSSWVIMIAGFALVGGAARRRRQPRPFALN